MSDTRTLHVKRSTSTAHRLTHYDGVCGNIHGHNMHWEVWVEVSMAGTGEDNMPLDLKTVADTIDRVDHAALLSRQEYDRVRELLGSNFDHSKELIEDFFGDVLWFNGDPTCEVMAKWMATRIYEQSEAIENVELEVAETDKYSISAEHP